jgi:transcriptional regulator with XRE-family HTH domain
MAAIGTPPVLAILRERLRQRLDACGLTGKAAARAAKLGDSFVSDVLNGKSEGPSLVALHALAKVLDTTVAYLVGETDRSSSRNGRNRRSMLRLASAVGAGSIWSVTRRPSAAMPSSARGAKPDSVMSAAAVSRSVRGIIRLDDANRRGTMQVMVWRACS